MQPAGTMVFVVGLFLQAAGARALQPTDQCCCMSAVLFSQGAGRPMGVKAGLKGSQQAQGRVRLYLLWPCALWGHVWVVRNYCGGALHMQPACTLQLILCDVGTTCGCNIMWGWFFMVQGHVVGLGRALELASVGTALASTCV